MRMAAAIDLRYQRSQLRQHPQSNLDQLPFGFSSMIPKTSISLCSIIDETPPKILPVPNISFSIVTPLRHFSLQSDLDESHRYRLNWITSVQHQMNRMRGRSINKQRGQVGIRNSADPLNVLDPSSSLNDKSGRSKSRQRRLKDRSGSADTLPMTTRTDAVFPFPSTMSHEKKMIVSGCCLKDFPHYRKHSSAGASLCSFTSVRSSSLNARKMTLPMKISNQRYLAEIL